MPAALARSRFSGVLDGADMARTFAWLRPNDLIWHFVVNNYVLGNEPPAFDVLYWNSDTTRLPAALHADLLMIYRNNRLRSGGDFAIDGVEIDIRRIDRDVFVVAGARDHITPWQACYRSMQMFRANMRFVLGAAGHVQSILCPPDDDSARFYVNDDYSLDPAAWRRGARELGVAVDGGVVLDLLGARGELERRGRLLGVELRRRRVRVRVFDSCASLLAPRVQAPAVRRQPRRRRVRGMTHRVGVRASAFVFAFGAFDLDAFGVRRFASRLSEHPVPSKPVLHFFRRFPPHFTPRRPLGVPRARR